MKKVLMAAVALGLSIVGFDSAEAARPGEGVCRAASRNQRLTCARSARQAGRDCRKAGRVQRRSCRDAAQLANTLKLVKDPKSFIVTESLRHVKRTECATARHNAVQQCQLTRTQAIGRCNNARDVARHACLVARWGKGGGLK